MPRALAALRGEHPIHRRTAVLKPPVIPTFVVSLSLDVKPVKMRMCGTTRVETRSNISATWPSSTAPHRGPGPARPHDERRQTASPHRRISSQRGGGEHIDVLQVGEPPRTRQGGGRRDGLIFPGGESTAMAIMTEGDGLFVLREAVGNGGQPATRAASSCWRTTASARRRAARHWSAAWTARSAATTLARKSRPSSCPSRAFPTRRRPYLLGRRRS